MTNKLLVGVLIVSVLALLGVLYIAANPVSVPAPQQVIVKETTVQYNDTAVKDAIAKLDADINEEDNFEVVCKELATDEWSAKGYKDIFNALVNIDEKEDILSVKVTDDDVSGVDVDEGDCDVSQELTVKYEDSDGEHVKVHLLIETEIVDNEVEDQTITLL